MADLTVALMMGGRSAEREVSLHSGEAVGAALQRLGHRVHAVNDIAELKQLNKQTIDVVFNILHGADGEDGQLAAWLAMEGYANTSCDYFGASLSWHKAQAKVLVSQAGVATPASQYLQSAAELTVAGAGPWIVKPATEGSSVGLFKAENEAELHSAVQSAFSVADSILVESYIDGIECTVGVVGDVVLPVVSIVPATELYDYQAKYQSTETQYHCPAHFNEDWQLALQADAKKACEALDIKGWGRVDFIVDETGKPWFLEVNTTPGMTVNSLLPKAAAAHGWSFDQLVANILATSGVIE